MLHILKPLYGGVGDDDDYIIITRSSYNTLLRAEKKLEALEDAGVDNWEGYGYAMEQFWDE